MKFVIILALLAILASLGSALFFMLRKTGTRECSATEDAARNRKMLRGLILRVALSAALFICLLVSAKLGYIQPNQWYFKP